MDDGATEPLQFLVGLRSVSRLHVIRCVGRDPETDSTNRLKKAVDSGTSVARALVIDENFDVVKSTKESDDLDIEKVQVKRQQLLCICILYFVS